MTLSGLKMILSCYILLPENEYKLTPGNIQYYIVRLLTSCFQRVSFRRGRWKKPFLMLLRAVTGSLRLPE